MKGGRARSLSGIDRLRSVLSRSGEPVAMETPCERTVLTVESFGIPVPLPWADVSKRGDTRERPKEIPLRSSRAQVVSRSHMTNRQAKWDRTLPAIPDFQHYALGCRTVGW
jgi:hypothetical protein